MPGRAAPWRQRAAASSRGALVCAVLLWRTLTAAVRAPLVSAVLTRRPVAAAARIALIGAALLHAACAPPDEVPGLDDVTFEDERRVDLTSDGRTERVHVDASGPSYDSLRIMLSVRDAGDSLLYRESWSSAAYVTALEPLAADTTLQRIVRGHLTELLRDAAFAPPAIVGGVLQPTGVTPDPEAVRYDVAEHSWRRSAGVPDTVPLPPGAREEIRELLVAEEDVQALVAELARQPSFTYHPGDHSRTIAWSEQERRFIRIRACC